MFSRIHTAVCRGVEGTEVFVETDIARGLPGIYIVGLASTMVMESRERIKSAIINSDLEYPRGRITVNLTPASLRKTGSGLDLPIAAGVLSSCAYIDAAKAWEYGIVGELSLEGRVLGVNGVLPMMICMKDAGLRKVIIPAENEVEASLVSGMEIYPVRTLTECIEIINGGGCAASQVIAVDEDGVVIERRQSTSSGINAEAVRQNQQKTLTCGDFADIKGQENAKRALTIAVAGRHGILMVGSPGCGKTMLASRLPGIMPPMTEKECLETAVIYSAAGKMRSTEELMTRPFRNPHCTIGRAGLIGGGSIPVPGEITLAHNGVLFMDEVCEYDTGTIEALRTPIEEKKIVHFRKGDSYVFPCNFQLVMAANPCPCGYFGDSKRICKCSEAQLERYRKKLSGPMMDRIDMRISMEKVEYEDLRGSGHMTSEGKRKDEPAGDSDVVRTCVERAIHFAHSNGRLVYNSDMTDSEIDKYCILGPAEEKFMKRAYDALKMTPRSYKKTLKVARTIADLAGSADIHEEHLAEALSYRMLDQVNE